MENLAYREKIIFDNFKKHVDGIDDDIKRVIWSNILNKISKDCSIEDILLITAKEFMLNGINGLITNEYNILYKPSRYSNLDYNRLIMLTYELIGEDLYIYDKAALMEHQVRYKVTKINGVEVSDLIEFIDKEKQLSKDDICKILIHKELLRPINQKENDDYEITIVVDEKERTISLDAHKDYLLLEMFEKKHSTAKILSKDNFHEDINFQEVVNSKLSYVYDSSNKLLKILLGLSRSEDDKQLFNKLLETQGNLYDINFQTDQYLDWMYISSFFLFYDKSLENLSPYVYDEIALSVKYFNFFFLDKNNEEVSLSNDNYGSNDYIIEKVDVAQSMNIDYLKLVKSIRNAFAHGSYEVIDDNYVRIYGYNEDLNELNVNLKIHKEFIVRIIEKLMKSTNLNNLFPCCCLKGYFGELIGEYKNLETEEEIIKFLNNISVLNLENINLKHSDNEFSYALESFKNYSYINSLTGTKKLILNKLKFSRLNHYVDYEIKETEIDKDYVMKRIHQLGDDFYKHSLSNQFIIINEIMREKILSEQNIASIIFDVIGYGRGIKQGKSSGSIIDIIDETAVGYIHYNKYIQTALISYLNSILLYSYDKSYSNEIDCRELNFSSVMEINLEMILTSKENNLRQLINEKNNVLSGKKSLEEAKKRAEKDLNNPNFLNKAPIEIVRKRRTTLAEYTLKLENWDDEKEQEMVLKIDYEIEETTRMITEIKTGVFDVNKYVLEHIRNSLAHRNISFPNGFDFENIGNTVIKIEDYKEDKKTFEGKILLKNLLTEINNERFLTSIYSRLESEGYGRN